MASGGVAGTVTASASFSAETAAERLRKAMKGLGTDEKAIIEVLTSCSNAQRQELKTKFKVLYGKDLESELKSELSGKFEDVVLGLLMTPDMYDAHVVHKAIKGAGTDEDCVIEVMCSRSNAQIAACKTAYKTLYKKNLEDDLKGDTSGFFKRIMISLCAASREENTGVDQGRAAQDAQRLYKAGEGRLGTDESTFNQILAAQSYEQLNAVFREYNRISNRTIEKAIKSEMSGDLEKSMLAIVSCVQNRPGFFADELYKTMKGLGTSDQDLIRIVVSRAEVDMVQIKQEFIAKYKKTLASFIKDDCSGDYKRILVALVGE